MAETNTRPVRGKQSGLVSGWSMPGHNNSIVDREYQGKDNVDEDIKSPALVSAADYYCFTEFVASSWMAGAFYCLHYYSYGAYHLFMAQPFVGSLLLFGFRSGFRHIKLKYSYGLMIEWYDFLGSRYSEIFRRVDSTKFFKACDQGFYRRFKRNGLWRYNKIFSN